MTATSGNEAPSNAIAASSRIHVADLSPSTNDLPDHFLEAAIALVWPYSSSTRQLSLLLAEKDVRLGSSRGQVKVTFHNGCAKAVARSRLGIGDAIRLHLDSVSCRASGEQLSTPGKKVAWDLHVAKHVQIEVIRDSEPSTVIDYKSRSPSPELRNGTSAIIGTPQKASTVQINGSELSSPFVKTPARFPSGSYKDTTLDPFTKEGNLVQGRARKRTKFGRHSGGWRLAGDSDVDATDNIHTQTSPVLASSQQTNDLPDRRGSISVAETYGPSQTIDLTSDVEDESPSVAQTQLRESNAMREDQSLGEESASDARFMPPPSKIGPGAPISIPANDSDTRNESSPQIPAPRLMPLPSPGLALVSPLVSRSGYFPGISAPISELEQLGQQNINTTEIRQERDSSSTPPEQISPTKIAQEFGQEFLQSSPPILAEADREDQVDLDFLQQQIERDNATGTTSPKNVEVIEDEDMYGPPIEHGQVESIASENDFPESLISSPLAGKTHSWDLKTVEPTLHSPEPQVVSPNTGTKATDIEQPSPFQPAGQQLNDTALYRSHGFNGAVEEIQEPHRSLDASQPASSPLATEEGIPSSSSEMFVRPPKGIGITQDLITPEATQKPFREDEVSVSEENDEMQHQLPLTPIDTQPQMDTQLPQDAEEAADMTVLPPQPDEPELPSAEVQQKSVRRSSRRVLKKHITSDEITNEYFTPRKASNSAENLSAAKVAKSASTPQTLHLRSIRPDLEAEQPSQDTREKGVELVRRQSSRISVGGFSTSRKGVTTSLSYYPSLRSLSDHFNQAVDVLAVCSANSSKIERATKGPKDYYTTIHLADASFEETDNTTITAQLLRPRKDALPTTKRGDVILMRDMKVQTQDHKPMLLTTATSAWMGFQANDVSGASPILMTGPPIEFGPMEEIQARKLLRWWESEGKEKYPDTPVASQEDLAAEQQPSSPLPIASLSRPRLKPPPLQLGSRTGLRKRSDGVDNTNAFVHNQSQALPSAESFDKMPSQLESIQQSVEEYSPVSPTSTRHFARPVTRSMRGESSDLLSPTLTTRSAASISNMTPAAQSTTKHKRGGGGSIGGASTRSSRRSESVVHELRDGTKYVDDAASSGVNQALGSSSGIGQGHRRTRSRRDNSVVHELRDGAKYVD